MKRRGIIAVIALVALGVVTAVWRQQDQQPGSRGHESLSSPTLPKAPQPTPVADGLVEAGESPMNHLEFDRTRVSLPPAVNEPWRTAFFDNENCFEERKKWSAVEALPRWIRKALREGKPERAAAMLWTLKKLGEDKEAKIASEAVLAIYRLGDTENFAREKISAWIKNGWDLKTGVTGLWQSEYLDIRTRALQELAFFKDHSFDEVIYGAWLSNKDSEGIGLASVDLAYYLEKQGRGLPHEYWMQRLDIPYGFENALEIGEKKVMPELGAKLQLLFERLRESRPDSLDSGRAAVVASALFRQTGDARYRDYLADNAVAQLGAKSFESSLKKLLPGLAATNDKNAIEIVVGAMQHQNGVVRDTAIDALGNAQEPAATEALFEAAIQEAKEKQWFPQNKMRALLRQQNAIADAKYDRLKQALLSGKFGWTAAASDFDALEFFRKHGRQ